MKRAVQALVRSFDPPWIADAGGGVRGANAKYDLADVDGIAQVMRMSPTWSDTKPMLGFMWATAGALHTGDAHALVNRLNLRIASGLVWGKTERVRRVQVRAQRGSNDDMEDFEAEVLDDDVFRPVRKQGMGQWVVVEHEHLFVVVRGLDVTDLPGGPNRPRSMIYAPRGEHSAKPEEAWERIERIARASVGAVPDDAVEMFARRRRVGWGAWGRLDGNDLPARYEPAPQQEKSLWPSLPATSASTTSSG